MSTYKVIQDIEAEDKLIGPLSFRQFVYAGVCVIFLYLSFLVVTKGAAPVAAVFLPVAFISGFFAFPWGKDQPTEVWALAKIRFLLKPRKRIWDQSGVKELVTVTAPKHIDQALTNGLSQTEVQSRLRALADTIDSRGWAIKNVNVNLSTASPLSLSAPTSDRLVNLSNLPQPVPAIDVSASDDILDEHNNPVAQQFETMIAASTKAHRQEIIERMEAAGAAPAIPQTLPSSAPPAPSSAATPANDYWFLNQPSPATATPGAVTFNSQVVAPGTPSAALPVTPANPTPDEEALVKQLASQQHTGASAYSHLHTIQPLSARPASPPMSAPAQPVVKTPPAKVTAAPDAAILQLASNDDLNVATIAREAKRQELPTDEVVISLH